MKLSPLTAVSPLDGRYFTKTEALMPLCSEYGLLYFRVVVEIRWLQALSAQKEIKALSSFTASTKQFLEKIITDFSEKDAQRIKTLENKINHDVKAVEYFLKEKFATHAELKSASEFIHFACTSEDINNAAYALMLKNVRDTIVLPELKNILQQLTALAHRYADQAMLARTHGQAASPTTVGKEFANIAARLQRQYQQLQQISITAKMNGAVGNFNAHVAAYPQIDWLKVSEKFITGLGLQWQAYTTQIEPHDNLAEFLHIIIRSNTILIDACRDIWGYISLGYFKQKKLAHEVGSSTMPHKVNPIDFENAEGNLGLANALAEYFALKLPISRWQRDLTDSTVLRNIGSIFAYNLIAYASLVKGLGKLEMNAEKIQADLMENWAVLAEAIQTILRREGVDKPYEALKKLTRGQKITAKDLQQFIHSLPISAAVKTELIKLTPENYIGLAAKLAKKFK